MVCPVLGRSGFEGEAVEGEEEMSLEEPPPGSLSESLEDTKFSYKLGTCEGNKI